MSSPWFRMDQLLKCSVCSDRFRNPKLLPCNHTFCAEPCLEKAVERGKQQVKCPECSAEHRIPLQGGVQGFPNNVTLGRFLELRQQVSGREPELPASMQRCNTCKEKGQLEMCAHCSRKVCKDCKTAHVNILRKEIALINGQVREGLQQLSSALHTTEENAEKLQKNYIQVKDEIEEVVRRYNRDLLDTEAKLKHHLDIYLKSELKNMRRLEHDLQIELNNVNSNCDLVDKYVNNGVDWTDAELTDYKEIFQKTLEFLRAFDSDPTDCIRKVKFHPRSDPDVIHKTLIDFAEVKLNDECFNTGSNGDISNTVSSSSSNLNGPTVTLTPPQNNALSRSQSDHRLASHRQSQKKDRMQNEDMGPLSRRFRERFAMDRDSSEGDSNREHSPSSWRKELDDVRSNQKSRFSSRETIDESDSYEADAYSRNRTSFRIPEDGHISPIRDHVTETEDATKGPLSGVIKILDSPHVMERLHHSEVKQKKQKEEEERKAKMPPPAPPPVSRPMTRQMSEDEIEKQKKENKAAAAATASATATSNTASSKTVLGSETSRTPKTSTTAKPEESPARSYLSKYSSSRTTLEDSSPPRTRSSRDTLEDSTTRRSQRDTQTPSPRLRSWRTNNSAVTEREVSQSPPGSPTRTRDTQKPPVSPRPTPTGRKTSVTAEPEGRTSPYSRLYDGRRSSITSGSRVRDLSPEDSYSSRRNRIARSKSSHDLFPAEDSPEDDALTAIRNRYRTRRTREKSPEEAPRSWSQYLKNKYGSSGRAATSGLIRSRTSSSLATAKSGSDNSSDEDDTPRRRDYSRRGDSNSPRGFSLPRRTYMQKGKTCFKFGSRGTEHGFFTWPRGVCVGPDNTIVVADSNNHRVQVFNSSGKFIQEFGSYGSSEGEFDCLAAVTVNRIGQYIVSDRYNHRLQVFDPNGRFIRAFGCEGRMEGKFSYPWGVATDNLGFIYVCDKENHRIQVFQGDGTYVTKFGGIGQRPGELEHPHYVAVSTTNRVIVSDSNNHRIQIFDVNGRLLSTFGTEGSEEGQFKYPRGVAVDDQGYLIVGDSGNNRIQIFHPDGTFLKAFGTWGSGDGEFKGLEGIAVFPTGQILVCDRENHRIQVF
ncbi:RING finger protein nhl-1-like isoform X2 [Stegodyphus dumicola]|uniref:RING finger protein nhl-1-like isoform X2 n=1 Tax=Stegodyphus dumicola TaxID=202533 RepID=UPI0015A87A72|nr:RING finger protein nhl-1-like isoform X2 [Stegodyphus dumicola]